MLNCFRTTNQRQSQSRVYRLLDSLKVCVVDLFYLRIMLFVVGTVPDVGEVMKAAFMESTTTEVDSWYIH